MPNKYSIVRADKFCPRALERNYNLKCIGSLHCDKCEIRKNYGDTKEQLIAKIEQVLQWERLCGAKIDDTVAEKIVEFLGVEE